MTTIGHLTFEPIPLRRGCWKAEVTGLRYDIFQSVSGFLVRCQHTSPGSSGDTPIAGAPKVFYPSLQDAASACNAHYRALMR